MYKYASLQLVFPSTGLRKKTFMLKKIYFVTNTHHTMYSLPLTTQCFIIQSHLQAIWWQLFGHLLTMSNLFPVCPVFTSSGPVRTTAVFAPAVCLSTAHSSVCLALKKLTPGSGDWSICLQGQTYKDQWAGVSVCTGVFVYFYHC